MSQTAALDNIHILLIKIKRRLVKRRLKLIKT